MKYQNMVYYNEGPELLSEIERLRVAAERAIDIIPLARLHHKKENLCFALTPIMLASSSMSALKGYGTLGLILAGGSILTAFGARYHSKKRKELLDSCYTL